MSRTLTPQELQTRLASSQPPLLLDVRRAGDRDATRIPGAHWHDPQAVAEWAQDIPRDREVVLYCVRGGSVSNGTLDQLLAQGVNARYVEGGLEAWKAAGGKTEAA